MEPTIEVGEYVNIEEHPATAEVQRGSVVVYEYPADRSRLFVKRIVGVPGDVIEFAGADVKVNGQPAPTSTASPSQSTASVAPNSTRVTLAPGEYFVVGDNRTASFDSRDHGQITRSHIKGLVTEIEASSGAIRSVR